MSKWAIIGLGFISQRHIQAIQDIGDELIAVCDTDESKKVKVPNVPFYTNYVEMLIKEKPEYVAVCTPNYLHAEMIETCRGIDAQVLCEKPLVLNIKDLEHLWEMDNDERKPTFTVLQLRHNPELQALKAEIGTWPKEKIALVDMNLLLNRGQFYFDGWKGNEKKSGGLLFNIGIHYFDLLCWFFGNPTDAEIEQMNEKEAKGTIDFKQACVKWHLSIQQPQDNQIRYLVIDGDVIDLTRHFEDLHTKVYQDVKQGKGVGIEEAGRTIKLIEQMQTKYGL